MSDSIDAVAADYWHSYLAFNPVAATSIGDRRFDDRLDDRSSEAIESHLAALEAFRGRAERIDE
ncbi:MAG TPA: hypothetical protein VGC90_10025, partial [Candidatus Limnocylindrales bacterium]